MTPEGQVQNAILKYVKYLQDTGHKIWCDKRQAGGFSYKVGLPDVYGTCNGYHIEIEVKRPGGERRASQEKWEERFKQLDVHYCCVDSLDAFKLWLKENFKIDTK